MPATITWEELRELAAFRAVRGCAVSLYVDLDPSTAPTAADVDARVNALLDEAEKQAGRSARTLDHEGRTGLRGDLERIRQWFGTEFDRDGVHGVAAFADGVDNLWTTIELPEAVPDHVKISGELYLAPLMSAAGRAECALVGVVGRERGQVFRLEAGRLHEIAERTDDVPGRHDQGGWSQANYERHIDELAARHLRRVAATLDDCVRRHRGAPVALVGAEEVRPAFERMLAHDTCARAVGWTTAEAHADGPRLATAVGPLLDAWWANRESELLERWRQEAAKNGRATAGWEETLEAASDGRVDLLLAQLGVDRPAYECPACGRAQMTNGGCPIDGTAMESRDTGLDVAVHKTLVNGGTVQVIRDRHDLDPVGGIAALLRY
ncbi:MAG: Vms1/Ankzf1 family peptidyl-tRNA hydrolase [Gaiellaceae bacterium]